MPVPTVRRPLIVASLVFAAGFALSVSATAQRGSQQERPSPAASTAAPRPACAKGETVVFSCPLDNGKSVALCIAKDGEGRAFGQYRYGNRARPAELVWPQSARAGTLDYANAIYSGGGEQQISFARGAYRYTLFSRLARTNYTPGEPNNPLIDDGLVVTRNGRKVAAYACTGSTLMPVQMTPAERYLNKVDDLFVDVDVPKRRTR